MVALKTIATIELLLKAFIENKKAFKNFALTLHLTMLVYFSLLNYTQKLLIFNAF